MTRWPIRPTLSSRFYKAHGLGNDYLVFEEGGKWLASAENVRRVCDRFGGVGGDGIVVLLSDEGRVERPPKRGARIAHARVSLRMFNPDGGDLDSGQHPPLPPQTLFFFFMTR